MSDDKAGAAFHQMQQRLLDARFGAGINTAGGFILINPIADWLMSIPSACMECSNRGTVW